MLSEGNPVAGSSSRQSTCQNASPQKPVAYDPTEQPDCRCYHHNNINNDQSDTDRSAATARLQQQRRTRVGRVGPRRFAQSRKVSVVCCDSGAEWCDAATRLHRGDGQWGIEQSPKKSLRWRRSVFRVLAQFPHGRRHHHYRHYPNCLVERQLVKRKKKNFTLLSLPPRHHTMCCVSSLFVPSLLVCVCVCVCTHYAPGYLSRMKERWEREQSAVRDGSESWHEMRKS